MNNGYNKINNLKKKLKTPKFKLKKILLKNVQYNNNVKKVKDQRMTFFKKIIEIMKTI